MIKARIRQEKKRHKIVIKNYERDIERIKIMREG